MTTAIGFSTSIHQVPPLPAPCHVSPVRARCKRESEGRKILQILGGVAWWGHPGSYTKEDTWI